MTNQNSRTAALGRGSMVGIVCTLAPLIGKEMNPETEKAITTIAMQELGVLLVVHVDPTDTEDERVRKIRGQISRILAILDRELTFHDLQIQFLEKETRIRFDLVVPYHYRRQDEERIKSQVTGLMHELDGHNCCEITRKRIRKSIRDIRHSKMLLYCRQMFRQNHPLLLYPEQQYKYKLRPLCLNSHQEDNLQLQQHMRNGRLHGWLRVLLL